MNTEGNNKLYQPKATAMQKEDSENLHAGDSLAVGASCSSDAYLFSLFPLPSWSPASHTASFVHLTPIQATPSSRPFTYQPALDIIQDQISAPSIEGNEITWTQVPKPKLNISDPKLVDYAKGAPVEEFDKAEHSEDLEQEQELGLIKLFDWDCLSVANKSSSQIQ